MTRQERTEALALAHYLPIPLRQEAREGRDNSIIQRFDAMERDGDPVVFAVFQASDIAKLPDDTLQGLRMLVVEDGKLRGSPDAFFMRGPNGVNLYINTDNDNGMVDKIIDTALEEGVVVEVADGDLRNLMDDKGLIVAPEAPAFSSFSHVPVRQAVDHIQELREERQQEVRKVLEDEQPNPLSLG